MNNTVYFLGFMLEKCRDENYGKLFKIKDEILWEEIQEKEKYFVCLEHILVPKSILEAKGNIFVPKLYFCLKNNCIDFLSFTGNIDSIAKECV
jgi:hypothetical protein